LRLDPNAAAGFLRRRPAIWRSAGTSWLRVPALLTYDAAYPHRCACPSLTGAILAGAHVGDRFTLTSACDASPLPPSG
jgi:hypothetical protein